MKDLREALSHPAIVLVQARGDLAPYQAQLAELLAQTIRRDFGDPVLVARAIDVPIEQQQAAGDEPSEPDELGLTRATLSASGDLQTAIEALRASLITTARSFAFTVLDASSRGPAFTEALANSLGGADTGDLAGRLVVLARDRVDPPARPGWSVLRTDVLAPAPLAEATSVRDRVSRAGVIGALEWNRINRVAEEAHGHAYPEERVDPEQCRFVFDPAWLRVTPLRIDRLPARAQRSFSRWARAVTGRRVGLALGGSGAFGFAHVALIEALEDRGVPIDLIAGSSSGSLMGAYYCALGRAGLELLVAQRDKLQLFAMLCTLTSAAIELRVDLDLGPIRLDDLEIPLLPVATNLSTGEAEIIRDASVAFGVRASGSAPGLFSSTLARDSVYVDGAVTDNVPVVLAQNEGAALVIAANALPPPQALHVPTPRTALGSILEQLSLARRAVDLFSSLSLMFHTVGDVDARTTKILYDPPPETLALFKTFEFAKAVEIMAKVRAEPQFQKTIDDAEKAWKALSAPRVVGVSP